SMSRATLRDEADIDIRRYLHRGRSEGGEHAVRQRALLPDRLLLIGASSGGHGHPSGRSYDLRPYLTRSRVRPRAGAAFGAVERSRAARIRRTSAAESRPSPTSTSVPTTIRTIWCKNAFA